MAAFCRVFAVANRLNALSNLTRLCKDAKFDALKTRDRFTIFFLSLGIAHEAVESLGRLEAVLKTKGCAAILDRDELRFLRDFRSRWGADLSRRLRNKLAFHFDPDCYIAGARRLGAGDSPCVAYFDRGLADAYFPLADDVLLLGTEECLNGKLNAENIREIATKLWDDQKLFSRRLFELFMQVMSTLSSR